MVLSRGILPGMLLGALFGCGLTEPTNRPPTLDSPALSVFHDEEYHQQIRVSDPDGDAVSVRAVTLPGWLTFDPATRILSGHPGVEEVGSHRVTLVATDGTADDTLSFLLEVVARTSSLIQGESWNAAGFPYGHDGEPFRSESFEVFSGFSRADTRRYVADALEGHLQDLKATFDISSDEELDGWDEGTRIDVLILRYQGTDVLWTGQSYRYGLIVHAPDSPRYVREGYDEALYDQLLRHELTHVLEYYLVGRRGTYASVEKWFHEGVAMVMGGTPPNRIASVEALGEWRRDMGSYPGQGNPIRIETNSDYPTPIRSNATQLGRYYLCFELAVRYLLDPDGLGRTPADVKGIYLDVRNGSSFSAAFSARMGIGVDWYETNFYSLMERYLG